MSRVSYILGQIRLNLKELSTSNIVDGELLYLCNEAQRQIMLETKCLEKTFTIQLQENNQAYDFQDENTLVIKKIFPSWAGKVSYVLNMDWEDYKDLTGSFPIVCTIFNNQIYFAPKPINSTDTVEIWASQTDVIDEMTEDVEPELPKICDRAIIAFVCSQYDEKFLPEYQHQLSLIRSNTIKTSMQPNNKSEW